VRETVTDTQALADLDIVTDELLRLARISERLLILVAAEHPNFLVREPVDVRGMLTDAVARWRPVADRFWSLDVRADAVLMADRDRLRYALDAVIENAVAFTKPGDLVRVSAELERHGVTIQVSDTGPGIDPADLQRILERFARGSPHRQHGTGGSGLGLPAVKAIVEAHGGWLVPSANPGGGARFTMWLTSIAPALPAPTRQLVGTTTAAGREAGARAG
jgi:signal transduction histidine kinase